MWKKKTTIESEPFESTETESAETAEIKRLERASILKQIWIITKIRFLHRVRNERIIIEIVMPLTFLVFICLFNMKQDKYSDDITSTTVDDPMPFSFIQGPDPKYGFIPEDTTTLRDALNYMCIYPNCVNEISSKFFSNFEEYESYINTEKLINESFYAVELSETENELLFRLSSSGMTIGTLPNYLQSLVNAYILSNPDPTLTTLPVNISFQPMPHKTIVVPDWYSGLAISLFGLFFVINGITNAGTSFAEEVETGVRDYLTFYGLSNFANNISWLICSIIPIWIPAIPFAIAISAQLDINFGCVCLIYLVGFFALTTFIMMMMAFSPNMSTGTYIGLIVSLLYFVLQLGAYYLFLTEVGNEIPKNVLSILPLAAFGYSMVMMCSGRLLTFSDINTVKEYNVKYAFIYLLVEGFVYFFLFYLVDYLKQRKWYKAPFTWKYQQPDDDDTPIIVDHLVKKYENNTAINDMSFSIKLGDIVAIVGPNGAGKSTLLGLLSGANPKTSGSISYNNVDVTENIETVHRLVGYCPQENIFLSTITPIEWLNAICALRGEPDYDYYPIIQALGLEHQLNKRLGEMSGGNKRKVCLAVALLCDPSIIYLDEATSGVDFTSRTRIWSLISQMKGKTIIMATHTLEECEKIADKIMVLSHGQVAEYDIPTKLRQDYKCGYVIEVAKQYKADAESVIHQFIDENELSFDETDEIIKYYITQNEKIHFSELLKSLKCPYLLSVQSLEEKIFEKVKQNENENQVNEEKVHHHDSEVIIAP